MRLFSAFLLTTTTLCVSAPAFAEEPAAPVAAAADNGDIVVTAERRSTSLQRTPIAVTALDSKALQNLQINRTADLQRVTPSLSVGQGTVDPTTLTVFMRGAGQNAGTWVGYESAVGLYIDDLYFGSLTGANLDLADLERIEVLRGPQGTLYGRNTLTGAIKYVTKKPGDTPFGDFEAEGGQKSMVRLKGTVSTPIAKDWAMLVSGNYYHRDGFYNAPQLNKNDYGFETDYGARTALAYTGAGPFHLKASAFYAHSNNDGSVGLATSPTTLAPAASDPYTYLSPIDGYGRSKTYGGDLSIGYDLGGGAQIKSITGVIHTAEDFLADTTAGQPSSRVGGPYPLGFDRLQSTAASTQFSEELQLIGDTLNNRLHYIGGLYYYQSIGHQDRQDFLLSTFNTLPQHVHLETHSYAAYGQATFDITGTLSAVAGLRYTHEKKEALGQTQNGATGTTYVPINPAPLNAEAWTPKFGLNWQATPDILAYGSVSRGFQAGGFNYLAVVNAVGYSTGFKPQTVWAYELGLKTRLFDRKGHLNIALYRNDFHDIQTNVIVGASSLTQNAGTARVEGIEAEFGYSPIRGLDFFASGAYNHDKYLNLNPASSAAAAHATHIPNVAHWQGDVGFSGRFPSSVGDLLLGSDVSYISGKYLGANEPAITYMHGYTLGNAYVGIAPKAVKGLELRFTVNNIGDKLYYVYGNVLGAYGIRSPGEPRLWKLSATFHY